MLKLTSAFSDYKLSELESLSLPDNALHKTSEYDYANCVLESIKAMELKVIASQWAIGYNGVLFGCVQVSPVNADKEVQKINDYDLPNSVLKVYTRFSATSQMYSPSFFGALFVDIVGDPYVMSSGFVGDKVHQAQGNFMQDIIEQGVAECHAFSMQAKSLSEILKKKKLKRHECFGIISDGFYKADLPITKIKKSFETLVEIETEKSTSLNGLDVLRAAYSIHQSFSVPDQYEFLAKAVPTMINILK